jgi:hypothetical protein
VTCDIVHFPGGFVVVYRGCRWVVLPLIMLLVVYCCSLDALSELRVVSEGALAFNLR